MAVCDASQNTPVPPWLTPIGQTNVKLTPAMVEFARTYAYDGTVPLNSEHDAWIDGKPIAAWVNCHTYTVLPDGTQQPGHFHGAAIYVITDPAHYPPTGDTITSPPEQTDWSAVAVSGAAVFAVIVAFFAVIKRKPR